MTRRCKRLHQNLTKETEEESILRSSSVCCVGVYLFSLFLICLPLDDVIVDDIAPFADNFFHRHGISLSPALSMTSSTVDELSVGEVHVVFLMEYLFIVVDNTEEGHKPQRHTTNTYIHKGSLFLGAITILITIEIHYMWRRSCLLPTCISFTSFPLPKSSLKTATIRQSVFSTESRKQNSSFGIGSSFEVLTVTLDLPRECPCYSTDGLKKNLPPSGSAFQTNSGGCYAVSS